MSWGDAAKWAVGTLAVFVVGAALVSTLAASLGDRFVARACAAVPDLGSPSPDGRFVARTAERTCGAADDGGQVRLTDRRGLVVPFVRPASRAVYVFRGSSDSVALTWRDARLLEVESPSCQAASRREWAWRGVRVTYRAGCEPDATGGAGVQPERS